MQRIALSLLAATLFAGAIAPGVQAVALESTPAVSRFDQLRRENLDKGQNNFDQLRRENLEKDHNNLDELHHSF